MRYGKSDCSPTEDPKLFVKVGGPVLSVNTSQSSSGNKHVCMPYITSPDSWHKTTKQLKYCSETTFTVVYNCTTETAVYNLIAHLPVSDNVGAHKTPPLWSWTLASAATVPQAPDAIVATRGGSFGEMWAGGVIDLEWQSPYDNGAFITGYAVMYTNMKTGDVGTFNVTAGEGCAKVGNPCLGQSVKAKVTGLNNADHYDLSVQAINAKGTRWVRKVERSKIGKDEKSRSREVETMGSKTYKTCPRHPRHSDSSDALMAPGPNTTFIAGMVFLGLLVIGLGVWGGYRLRDAVSGPAEAATPLLPSAAENQQGYQTGGDNADDLDARLAALDKA